MRRQNELIRKILERLSEHAEPVLARYALVDPLVRDGHPRPIVEYHLTLCGQAGFTRFVIVSTDDNDGIPGFQLTWAGHEHLSKLAR